MAPLDTGLLRVSGAANGLLALFIIVCPLLYNKPMDHFHAFLEPEADILDPSLPKSEARRLPEAIES
jgi:hypothetical protein